MNEENKNKGKLTNAQMARAYKKTLDALRDRAEDEQQELANATFWHAVNAVEGATKDDAPEDLHDLKLLETLIEGYDKAIIEDRSIDRKNHAAALDALIPHLREHERYADFTKRRKNNMNEENKTVVNSINHNRLKYFRNTLDALWEQAEIEQGKLRGDAFFAARNAAANKSVAELHNALSKYDIEFNRFHDFIKEEK